MKKLTLILVVVLLASTALMAFEHEGRSSHPGMMMGEKGQHRDMGMKFLMIADKLELSDELKAEIVKIHENNRKKIIRIKADIEILRIDKKAAMRVHDFKLQKKINEQISAKNLKMKNNRVEVHEQVWNKLSKEQQEKADKFMREHHSRPMQKRCQ